MSKNFDYVVYIGRFQPFHLGHLKTLRHACSISHNVIVLIGSSNKAKDTKNPWSAAERVAMINRAAQKDGLDITRISFLLINDYPYRDNVWVSDVQNLVNSFVRGGDIDNPSIGIIGFKRDHTSYYLNMFPQWENIEINEIFDENNLPYKATNIRSLFFEDKDITHCVPLSVNEWLSEYKCTYVEEYSLRVKEYEYIKKYKSQWENSPYPPTFVTVDAVVVQSGHILLVKRGSEPGEGLWALPGGFINQNEKIEDAMLRELKEETRLKVPLPVLRGSIKKKDVFDDPERSQRGRTITHAFYIELAPGELPPVKGSDDAKKAKWIPLGEFKRMDSVMFEDHAAIVSCLMGG